MAMPWATNQFDDAAGDVTYLSRADHFANYAKATAAPTNFKMSDKAKAEFYNNTRTTIRRSMTTIPTRCRPPVPRMA